MTAAFICLLVLSPAQAARIVRAPAKPANAVTVIENLEISLSAINPLSPLRDLPTPLWKMYSSPKLTEGEALAASVLLGAIQRPELLPEISQRLRDMASDPRIGKGQMAADQLQSLAVKFEQAPADVKALQFLLAPLQKKLSRVAPLGEAPDDLKPILDVLFENNGSGKGRTSVVAGQNLWRSNPKGAGSRNFGLKVGKGGVKPLDYRSWIQRLRLSPVLIEIDANRSPGPRILSGAELEALQRGRARPSDTNGVSEIAFFNSFRAARLVNTYVRMGRELELGMLMKINSLLRKDIRFHQGEAQPGELRRHRLIDFQGSEKFEYSHPGIMLQHLADFWVWYEANKNRLHPVLFASEVYQQLIRIHPFSDGNGRTTRLIMDFILQSKGYLPPLFTATSADAVHVPTHSITENVAQGILDAGNKLEAR